MSDRIFKTAWFAKAAKKARIADDALRMAIRQVEQGQADDLGGGVFKKRLDHNRQRAIILAKAGEFWVYTYLFAKQDRANIDDDELPHSANWRNYIVARRPEISKKNCRAAR